MLTKLRSFMLEPRGGSWRLVRVAVCGLAAVSVGFVTWARNEEAVDLPLPEDGGHDSRWRSGFHVTGFDERVRAFTEYRGELIAGGRFTRAGETTANLIARYDGISWKTLGKSVSGGTNVHALTTHEDRLIVGGHFSQAGDTPVRNIATWDGTSWQPLGGGFNGWVVALCVYRGALIAGGTFSEADGNPAPGIALWDGSRWQGLSSGVSGGLGDVNALVVYGDRLIIGGSFTSFAGVAASNVATWDGERATPLTSEWLGQSDEGTSGTVVALAVFDSFLVAGGAFNNAAGRPVNKIAAWDGTRWKDLAGGVLQGNVHSFATHDGRLVVGGSFDTAGAEWDGLSWRPGVLVNNIAAWDGSSWQRLATGTSALPGFLLTPDVYAMASFRGDLFIGGAFIFAGGAFTPAIARWDGTSWHAVSTGQGLLGAAYGVTVYDGKVAVGGQFRWAGDPPNPSTQHIALWNGAHWEALGTGVDSLVTAVHAFGGDLIVGGRFREASGIPVNHIARWDGTNWHPMGAGFDGTVFGLASKAGVLYAGGGFIASGATAVNHVAYWDGASWAPLGDGLDAEVLTLAVHRDTLVAGGNFRHSGPTSARFIARWDGSSWQPIGPGFNSSVRALATYRGELIAAGIFNYSGTGEVGPLARWNGSVWEGFLGYALEVDALHVLNDRLFAGGVFRMAGETSVANIARWDGAMWSPLGSGTNNPVYSLSSQGGSLLVGGGFTFAGDKGSQGIAIWDEVAVEVTVQDLHVSRTEAGIDLRWKLAAGASELASIRVQRAEQPFGPFEDRSAWLVPRESMQFLDEDADPNAAYWYRLVLRHGNETESTSRPVFIESMVSVGSGETWLQVTQTDAMVRIRYWIASGPVTVSLVIYDVKGRRIATLERGVKERGEYTASWDTRDENGIAVPRGLYFARLEANGVETSRKFLRLRP